MRRTIVASLQMSDEPFFCVFATYCSLCFQICIIPVLRGGFTRAYMRASGGFCFFAFTPSPVCHKLLSERKKRVKVFVLLPSHAVHPFGKRGEGSTSPKSSPENG